MRTIVEAIRRHARETPDRIALRYVGSAGPAALSFAALDRAACGLAASLSALETGARVLLVFPPGPDFAVALLGCLYARMLPVPLPFPRRFRREEHFASIAQDCGAALLLTSATTIAAVADAFPEGTAPAIRPVGHDFCGAEAIARMPLPAPEDAALLQYTSGATGMPKGVLVTHENLAANVAAISGAFRITQSDVLVTWLPHYHDMGLVGALITPLVEGVEAVALSPQDMLRQPALWLRTISAHRATISGGPPFGYERCIARAPEQVRAELDLSEWRLAFVGAEPVSADLLDRFSNAFAIRGFRRSAFYPCYGLAESTLFVSGGEAGSGYRRTAVGGDALLCGAPSPGHRVLIVDPHRRVPVPDGGEGEIWIAGPSIAAGYWGRPVETRETFMASLANGDAARFLRTGDLGRIEGGSLVVTGRMKDIVIVAGRNHHAEDLERSALRACPELPAGSFAAFSVPRASGEALVLAVEAAQDDALHVRLREAMAREHDLALHDVHCVVHLPRTTSGKISRAGCRSLYLDRIGAVPHDATAVAAPDQARSSI